MLAPESPGQFQIVGVLNFPISPWEPRLVSHPNVISLVDSFEDVRAFQLVVEFCGGGELFDKVSLLFFFCWGRGGGVGDAYGFFHNTTETLFGFIKLQVPRSCGICR